VALGLTALQARVLTTAVVKTARQASLRILEVARVSNVIRGVTRQLQAQTAASIARQGNSQALGARNAATSRQSKLCRILAERLAVKRLLYTS